MNVVVDECFAGEIQDVDRLLLPDQGVTDRLEEVRLAQTDGAMKEERVVGSRRVLRNSHRSCMRYAIARTYDEMLESIRLVEHDVGIAPVVGEVLLHRIV